MRKQRRRSAVRSDQRLRFRYIDSQIPLLSEYEPLAIFCDCTARFVSDQVRNPEDRFPHNEAHKALLPGARLASFHVNILIF